MGPVELAILQAIDARLAGRQYVTCATVLPGIEERVGLGPRYAWPALCDLARQPGIAAPVITVHGNAGDRHYSPGEPQQAECRPSRTGRLVLAAEAGALAPVPVGLINGTAYRGGTQPPLEPGRVIAALRHVLDQPGVADADLLEIAGPPYSVTGCTVTGDLDALAAGQRILLREASRITLTGNPVPEQDLGPGWRPGATSQERHAEFVRGGLARAQLLIESLPPGVSPHVVFSGLGDHQDHGHDVILAHRKRYDRTLPIAGLSDLGSEYGPVRIALTLRPGTDPDSARDRIAAAEGLSTEVPAAYPAPLAVLLRGWAGRHRGEDLAASLTRLEDAIRRDAGPVSD
jgi:hypothetical protein